jgi:hypothetical protein
VIIEKQIFQHRFALLSESLHRGRGVAKFKTKILHRFYPIDFRPCIQRVLRWGVLNRRIFNQRIGNFAKFLLSKTPKTLLGAECLSTQGKEFWLDAQRALNGKIDCKSEFFFYVANLLRIALEIFRNSANSQCKFGPQSLNAIQAARLQIARYESTRQTNREYRILEDPRFKNKVSQGLLKER